MTRILINQNYGGFCLSKKAMERLCELGSEVAIQYIRDTEEFEDCNFPPIKRDDPLLIQVFDELGVETDNDGDLKIVEIPDDVEWVLQEYDGREWIAEKHRTWY